MLEDALARLVLCGALGALTLRCARPRLALRRQRADGLRERLVRLATLLGEPINFSRVPCAVRITEAF